MVRKYIMLFEDFAADKKDQADSSVSTWADIRDAIQLKLPFVIVTFGDKESYNSALKSDLFPNHIEQVATMSSSEGMVDYPSLFSTVDDDVSFKNKIPNLLDSFKVHSIILGKRGEEYCDIYLKDGTSSPAGNEVVSSLDKDDVKDENHFKVGSTYYKFIDFVDM